MPLNQNARPKVIETISRAYDIDQFDSLVRALLRQGLAFYASTKLPMPTIVDQLLSALERQGEPVLVDFLIKVREVTHRPELRAAVDDFLATATVSANSYQALVVFGEPIVDRHLLRKHLQVLFTGNKRLLVVRGEKTPGKSHSRWLIQHVAQSQGFELVYCDLVGNSVDEIVGQIINDMSLPPQDFRDRLAQFSTVAKGFISALRGYSRKQPLQHQQWCLVFDGYDREQVAESIRELVGPLVQDIANFGMPPISVILLGYRGTALSKVMARALEEEIQPLTEADVEKFFDDLRKCDQFCPQRSSAKMRKSVFDGLSLPLNSDGMYQIASRIRAELDNP